MRQPQAVRIVAVGDELLLGRVVDTNSAFLADLCLQQGLAVRSLAVVGDDQADIVAALADAGRDAVLILVTGGLGPTEDDRTRHALAEVLGVDLVEDARAWRGIQAAYHRFRPGAQVPASNRRQALKPRGAVLLANDRGTAPGLLARHGRTWIALLPGVPHEMRAMAERLMARLPRLLPDLAVPAVGEVHFAGLGESAAQDRLGDLLTPRQGLQVGICAHDSGHITIRCVGTRTAVDRRLAAIRRVLASHVLPLAGLAPSLIAELARRQARITTAESCTCGTLAAQLGAVPGVSAVLDEGIISYANAAKTAHLGVAPTILARHGAVSEPVVQAMAEGALERSGADLALAVTGIAGPEGGSRAKPVGTVWIAAALRTPAGSHTTTRLLSLRGSRVRIQQRAAASALLLGWEVLLQAPRRTKRLDRGDRTAGW